MNKKVSKLKNVLRFFVAWIKKVIGSILLKMGCNDISLMLYGLKNFNFKLLLDGIFFGEYHYFDHPATKRLAAKFEKYLGDKKYKDNLIKGVDDFSVETVNQLEKNLRFVLDTKFPCIIKPSDFGIKENIYKVEKDVERYTKDIYLPINHKEETVFYYKHGIDHVEGLEAFIKGKDIIDCGAFIGDSAMMFSKELGFQGFGGVLGRIYCLEPEPDNIKLLKETIDKNGMLGKIIPIPLGVGQQKETLHINPKGNASTIGKEGGLGCVIEVDTIDNIVRNYGITPGLIKWDIEGLEYESLLGAKKTIQKYKPVLLISIYHNGRDFYEIKPLLESWNLGYKFKIRHLSTHFFFETMLICY